METIDVHDLPEPVARAIALMVDSLRTAAQPQASSVHSLTTGQILAPLIEEAAALPREPGQRLEGQEAEIADLIIEKFKRQGLKL